MKKIKIAVATFMVALFGVVAFAPVAQVAAYDPLGGDVCPQGSTSEVCKNKGESADDLIGTVVNTLLWVVGVLSVVMIIVAGIMYTTSTGDSGRVSKAKNTLTYSIVGLIVSVIAYAIVNWVFDLF